MICLSEVAEEVPLKGDQAVAEQAPLCVGRSVVIVNRSP